ncbi:MAG TPA: hypothetical protein VJP45_06150 [Candidatus Limnocylindria bacterium]|nr:hypothetical protein [Candidatus Limnocylindria bacterium]
MTEGPWAELGTALHAHRIELLRIAGRMAERSRRMAEAASTTSGVVDEGKVDEWADETAEDAQTLASQVESLTRRADALLDDTAVMSLDAVADE